jgi:uncharacterized phage protein (TIGR01671 family)
MNDRFKFRVWKGQENRMVYEVTYLNPLILDPSIKEENKHNILMQCTGLKDKNGKLIYEGDIIKINTWFDKIVPDNFEYRYEDEKGFALYQIFFNQAKARFEAECIKYTKERPYRCFLLEYVPTNNEVIGNIYENRELLNES